jgi:hypothetical protein
VKLDPELSVWFGSLPRGEIKAKIDGMLDTLKERGLMQKMITFAGVSGLVYLSIRELTTFGDTKLSDR